MHVVLQQHGTFDLDQDWPRYLLAQQHPTDGFVGVPLLLTPVSDGNLWLQPGSIQEAGTGNEWIHPEDADSILIAADDLLGLTTVSGGSFVPMDDNLIDPQGGQYSWLTREASGGALTVNCSIRFEQDAPVDFSFRIEAGLRDDFDRIIRLLAEGKPFPSHTISQMHLTGKLCQRETLTSILWAQR